jgi:DNA-binding transcriptional LysR family regulator
MILHKLQFHSIFSMLKLQQLRQFVIAASSGSFKTAATTTFRSQAAVSIAMRELENQIGGPLLERGRRGKFTPLAEALLPLFEELLAVHDRVLDHSRKLAVGEQGSLSVAVPPFLAEEWLPEIIVRFVRLHPRVRIRAIEERSSQIRSLVAEGRVNIGIAGLLVDDSRLSIKPIAIDPFGVLCSAEHTFARKKTTSWKSLGSEKVIGSDAFQLLAGAGLPDRIDPPALEVTSRAMLFSCVKRNLGVTILPMLTRPMHARDLAFVTLIRPKLTRTVAILTRRSETLLPAAVQLEAMLFESLRELAIKKGVLCV